jgi:HAD superfamily hydrolase (TIGR01490 family)
MNLALFDLDHTLLPMDSDYSWGEFTITLGWVDADHFKAQNDQFFADYRAGVLDLNKYVAFATEAFVTRGPEAAHAAHQRYMTEVIRPAMRPEAFALIEKHRAAGDRIVVVTATNEFVTRPIVEAFGVNELIAVELERDASGWFTQRVKGVPSAREGKVTRVKQWLAAQGKDWADVKHASFYTDSMNDIALMEMVHEPVATNPDPKLRALAQERGWGVLDLFQSHP